MGNKQEAVSPPCGRGALPKPSVNPVWVRNQGESLSSLYAARAGEKGNSSFPVSDGFMLMTKSLLWILKKRNWLCTLPALVWYEPPQFRIYILRNTFNLSFASHLVQDLGGKTEHSLFQASLEISTNCPSDFSSPTWHVLGSCFSLAGERRCILRCSMDTFINLPSEKVKLPWHQIHNYIL